MAAIIGGVIIYFIGCILEDIGKGNYGKRK